MPTPILGTCTEVLNLAFARLGAAADAKAAGGTPITHTPPLPGYTANYGIPYSSDANLARTFDILDAAIFTGTGGTAAVRFTADDAQNQNLRNILTTLAGAGILVPTA